jgi:hypothetical protein
MMLAAKYFTAIGLLGMTLYQATGLAQTDAANARRELPRSESDTQSRGKDGAGQVTEKSEKSPAEVRRIEQNVEAGWTLLLGLNLGRISESAIAAPAGHEPHSGTAFGGYLMLGGYRKWLAYDLGIGWSYSRIAGREIDAPGGQPVDVIVATQAGILMGATRYRFLEKLEGGLSLSQWAGPDLSFSSYESSPKTATFLGADLVYLSTSRDQIFRVRLSGMVDLTVPKRQVTIYALGLDFGLPLLRNDTLVRKTTVVKTQTVVRETEKKVTTTVPVRIPVIQMVIDNQLIKFIAGGARVDPKSDAYIARLGSELAKISDRFSAVSVRVTMSELPADPKRQAIAEQRAANVGHKLKTAGLAMQKIRFKGGVEKSLAPAPQGGAMHKLELQFIDATDQATIEQTVANINRQFTVPETCAAGDCK